MRTILEREREREMIDGVVRSLANDAGQTLVLQGPPGIGKTTLLESALGRASDGGITILAASAAELETSFAYGVVRQWLEPTMAKATTRERKRLLAGAAAPAAQIADPLLPPSEKRRMEASALHHAIYWLLANVAAERPIVLAVDDAHWCDPASLACIAYLARRIDALPIALLLARRSSSEPGVDPTLLDSIGALRTTRTIDLAPLSEAAVQTLVPSGSGSEVALAVHSATGGNPLYVVELVRLIERVAPATNPMHAIKELGPRSVAEIALSRIARLSNNAQRVARAIAILEPNATLGFVSAMSDLDVDTVASAADELFGADLLAAVSPCRFAHPIVRSAIEHDLPPAARGRAHARAAEVLNKSDGVTTSIVASHLLRSPPCGDREVVNVLRAAAHEALQRGAPAEASTALARALLEPPPQGARAELLLTLGSAELLSQRPECITHLREALALAIDPDMKTRCATTLGKALSFAGQVDAAFDLLNGFDASGASVPLALDLDAALLVVALPAGRFPETKALAARRRSELLVSRADGPGLSESERRVVGTIAFRALTSGEPRDEVLALAEQSLLGPGGRALGLELGDDGIALIMVWLDEIDRANTLLTEAIAAALEVGSLSVVSTFAITRAYAAYRCGDLARVEADVAYGLAGSAEQAEPSEQQAAEQEASFARICGLVSTVPTLVERGNAGAALDLVDRIRIPPAVERMSFVALIRHAKGLALMAQHRYTDAVTVLEDVGATFERSAIVSPAVASWRSDLALAYLASGRKEEARELAREELRLAERTAILTAQAKALRALGLIEGGESGIARLTEAAVMFERSPARLERARALCDLGAAMRRSNQRREARVHLQAALDLAGACGARAISERAWGELRASGAKPRRLIFSGIEALTGAELRVCQLAAEGLSNAEIAQSLLVTKKTVEAQLGSAYRKLEIAGRDELARALSAH